MANAEKAVYEGTCYICGLMTTKTKKKNHMLKHHDIGDEDCFLIKAEDPWNKYYWLLFDVPQNKSMSAVDTFLKNIWLECCGHLSAFDGVGKSTKLADLPMGFSCEHEYDMGSTTVTKVTVVDVIKRPKQAKPRLLARNLPPVIQCSKCKLSAEVICMECLWEDEAEFYCENCYNGHGHGNYSMDIVNSPRMGECGYDGELDIYTDPKEWIAKNGKLLEKYMSAK
jgi:hypothetical protein